LYPENEKELVLEFIETQLASYCKNKEFIIDSIGFGASKIK